ncbi:MAG: energy transducer TonB [Pseudomonadota bacterium]
MNFSHDKSPGKNFTSLAIVVVLHLFVGYAVVSGLGKRMVSKMKEAVETKLIEEVKAPPPKEVPPPPPPPEMKAPPPPFIPPVEVNVQQQPQVPSPIAQATSQKPATTELARPQAPVAAKAAGPSHTVAVVSFDNCAKPDYPKASLRNEESGTTNMRFLIGVDGHVVESQIVKSSGFRDLDKAAVAALSKCKFKPGTTDGKPEQSWAPVQYVWSLE